MMKKGDKVFLVTAGIVSAATVVLSDKYGVQCRIAGGVKTLDGMDLQDAFKHGAFYFGWVQPDGGQKQDVHCVKHLWHYPFSVVALWIYRRYEAWKFKRMLKAL